MKLLKSLLSRASVPKAPYIRPSDEEIIAACRQSLPVYREKESADAFWLAYTPTGRYRAAILRKGRLYRVQYSSLCIMDEEGMYTEWIIHGELQPQYLADWDDDPGESWFDDFSSAEGAALAVLAQLEADGENGTIEILPEEESQC